MIYNNKGVTIEMGKNMFMVTATLNTLIFKQVQQIVSNEENDSKKSSYKVINQFTIVLQNNDEIEELKKLLNNAYEQKIFTYKNITFDFTNYERKSVDRLMDQISWIEKFIPKSYLI